MSQFMNTIAISIKWGMSPPATTRAIIPRPYLPVLENSFQLHFFEWKYFSFEQNFI